MSIKVKIVTPSVPLKLLVIVLAVGSALAACGGGGGASTLPASVAPASASGPIRGFGSIVINGCRWSTIQSKVHDDLGNPLGTDNLYMGMQVQIDGNSDSTGTECMANDILVDKEFAGTISSVNSGANQFTLLGQTFTVDTGTFYQDQASSFASLAAGNYVEVYALAKPDGSYQATLVVKKTMAPASNVYEAQGQITNLNTGNTSFQIGTGLTVDYSGVQPAPTGLANGQLVKVVGNNLTAGGTTLQATKLISKTAKDQFANSAIEIEGYVQNDAGDQDPNTFTIADLPVNVSGASLRGLTQVTVGAFVEVKGNYDGTTLQATRVTTEAEREKEDGGRNELYGLAKNGTLNTTSNTLTFTVQNVNVSYSSASDVCGITTGTPYVEVKGNLSNGTLVANNVECKSTGGSTFSNNSFELHGVIASLSQGSSLFTLTDGTTVDYSAAQFEDGSVADLSAGERVEVKGQFDNTNNRVKAVKIELEDKRN
ncbi:DUF5666 domain-containing protein [Limnobacter litoralis]|uniref:DUF5666 domain-containing protein n=1 Tax=Limnobacter litoralis TaxID=481366 RepID=A0ABQ5YSD7_9BURK|nr:DUF5666 domain-containing protein [Limnobacter litoralis]GLR26295.1 hypothetical protein GCM10007875_13850 [Limnobacter litoralis]